MNVPTKIESGQVVATAAANAALQRAGDDPNVFLTRHLNGDWGELSEDDRGVNDQAMLDGSQLLSVYSLSDGTKIWVISDPEIGGRRTVTTILLPSDY